MRQSKAEETEKWTLSNPVPFRDKEIILCKAAYELSNSVPFKYKEITLCKAANEDLCCQGKVV